MSTSSLPGDRVEALIRDIESIPDLLEHVAPGDWLHDVLAWLPSARQVVLTGLGSSRFAAMQVEDGLRASGIDARVVPASAIPAAPPGTLCIAISSSGRTPEAVDAAGAHRSSGPVLAITRDPTSALAAAADRVALLPVVAESSGVATTTYVATIAVLLHVAAGLGAGAAPEMALRAAAAASRAVLDARSSWLPAALDALRGAETVQVLAPWSARGAAEQAALLLRECPRRSAEAYETAEWLHVGIYTALPWTAAMLFEGSPADAEVAAVIAGRSANLVRIPGDSADPVARAIARSTAAALLAAELWREVSTESA